jgi:hypothetical protein
MIESYFDKYDIYNVFIDYKERAWQLVNKMLE